MFAVSVVVPVYNVENLLDRCMTSLVNQTLDNIEIVVVNDGSPDNSQAIIDEYVEKYPGKVFSYIKENGGLADARNYGIERAHGEYVGFVDSDDFVDVRAFEKMYASAKKNDSDVVVCGYCLITEEEKLVSVCQVGNANLYGCSAAESPDMLPRTTPYAWNKMVRRSFLESTGILFPKGLNFEDICTMYPLMGFAKMVSKVDEPLVFYTKNRAGSITSSYGNNQVQMVEGLHLLCDRYEERGLFEQFRPQLQAICIRHIYSRLGEFHLYKNYSSQFKLVRRSFDLLNKRFPGWRESSSIEDFAVIRSYDEDHLAKMRSELYWLSRILTPVEKIAADRDKARKLFRGAFDPTEVYAHLIKVAKVVKNRVVVESFHGKNISDSPYYIMRELLKRGGYEIYVVTDEENEAANRRFLEAEGIADDVKVVILNSKEYCKVLATSEYLLNNMSFPGYFISRRDQKYLNTWHGTPLKTLGKSMRGGIESMHNILHNFLQSDYLLFPNPFTYEHMMRDYGMDKLFTKKAVISGYPRNAVFCSPDRGQEVREKLGLTDKTVYVYMPTWRGKNSIRNMTGGKVAQVLAAFDTVLDDDHVMYVNLHPNVGNEVDFSTLRYIQPFPDEVQNYDFINASDALISDYSSVSFDYSITQKPIVMFAYDKEEYLADRGLYVQLEDLPFRTVYELDDMLDLLKSGEILNWSYADDADYFDRFISCDSADATEKLVDYVFEGVQGNIEVVDYSFNGEKEWNVVVQDRTYLRKDEYDAYLATMDLDNTILAIRLNDFHPLMNEWFIEDYNDRLTYLVYRYVRVLDTKDKVAHSDPEHPDHRKVSRWARKMGRTRTLPGINIVNFQDVRKLL